MFRFGGNSCLGWLHFQWLYIVGRNLLSLPVGKYGKKRRRKKERSIEEAGLDFNCNTGHGSCNFNTPIKEHLFYTNLTHSIAVAVRFSFKLHTIIRLIYTLFLFIHIAILHIKIHL